MYFALTLTENRVNMKKLLVFLTLVLIGALFVFTCPDKSAHKEAIKAVVTNVANDRLNEHTSKKKSGFEFLGSLLINKAVDMALDSYLDVKNYFVVSIGEIYYQGETKQVSYGLLGHVFTFNEEQLQQAIDEQAGGLH